MKSDVKIQPPPLSPSGTELGSSKRDPIQRFKKIPEILTLSFYRWALRRNRGAGFVDHSQKDLYLENLERIKLASKKPPRIF